MSHGGNLALLLLGPGGATGLYWMLYRYYRNTDKSFDFEHKAKVDAKPIAGEDVKVGTNNGTTDANIAGNNVRLYRNRVKRV
ncbi:MAG TPA: hypothetical protein VH082_13895 [Rudaea sp.]|jgi:hypothetical protein|nr:hypothetical protein [Rudaea sp.]